MFRNRECIAATETAKNAIVKAKRKELKMAKINNTRTVYQKVSELKGTRSVQADMLRNEDGGTRLFRKERAMDATFQKSPECRESCRKWSAYF
jgi:hypothetical protein